MGQFYRTSKPQFVEDFMYQPPWELAKEVILAQDKKINDQLARAGKLEEVLNFNTLDFDKEKATEKKLQYTNEIQQITDLIKKDPENYSKYSDQLRKLQQTLVSDYTSGDIASMVGTYNSAQSFIKDHEKLKEKDAARYNAGYNSFYNNARTQRDTNGYKGDGSSVWKSEQLMESIDFTKGFVDYVTKLKPDSNTTASVGSNGKYIFKNKSSNEVLSQEQVRSLMADYVQSTPNVREYLDQTQRIGLDDPTKTLLDFADNFAYSKKSSDASQSVDSYGLAATQDAYARQRAATSFANQKALIDYRQQAKDKGILGGGTHAGAAKLVLGNTVMKAANLNPDDAVNYGVGALVGNNIIKPADGAKLQSYINNTFKDVKSFGSNKINFVFQKDFVNPTTKRAYKAGQSLTMTVQQAKTSGFIKNLVPNSGNPFYFDNENNGVNFKFTSPNGDGEQTDAIVGNLLPPGSVNGQVDVGYRIFNIE